jgi:antitoxin (DNA-binding transcriptional repressor) of toxin-antitoxin stability system
LKHLDSSAAGRRPVSAARFASAFLRLVELVGETGEEIVITRRNRPIAMLVPWPRKRFARSSGGPRGVIHGSRDDLLAPIGQDWQVDADL